MIKSHKIQHSVPLSYLKAWLDPSTPNKQEPYVWVFPRQGGEGKRKAPHNIFTENDMYTIHKADGVRDLRIEHGLCQLEGWFVEIRRDFLDKYKNIPLMRRTKLMAFIAALQCRTVAFRDHYRAHWQSVLNLMEEVEENLATVKKEQLHLLQFTNINSSSNQSWSKEDVIKLIKEPVQQTLPDFLSICVPIMVKMSIRVLCTNTKPGFITSDNPVVWFDPEAHQRPLTYNAPGLGWPTIEITMPISPKQLILITHKKDHKQIIEPVQYFNISENLVHELNRRTRAYSKSEIVVSQNYTNPHWFFKDVLKEQD